jgi:hypothetical protein
MIIALGTLVVLGGSVLFGFSVAMLLGIVIGTYSSIFIARPILIWLKVTMLCLGIAWPLYRCLTSSILILQQHRMFMEWPPCPCCWQIPNAGDF